MIKPEQIPDAAVTAAWNASSMLDAIAAAINAWPGVERIYRSEDEKLFTIIIPLPQEKTND